MLRFVFLVLAAALALAAPVRASALTFSDASTGSTLGSDLGAVLDIQVSGSTLTLTLTNASGFVQPERALLQRGTERLRAQPHERHPLHRNAGVTSAWPLFADGGPGNPTHVGSFDTFDFMLDGPVGQTDPALIGSGESTVFARDQRVLPVGNREDLR